MKVNRLGFEFYFNVFCNGTQGVIPAECFEKCVTFAKGELGKYISDRYDTSEYETEIGMCLCELAECIYQREKIGNIKSESVDGYSVSFVDRAVGKNEVSEIIFRWLGKTGLLYAGVE